MWDNAVGLLANTYRYVASCNACQKFKPSHSHPHFPLRTLPVPLHPWSSIIWDHLGPLPPSDGSDAILVIVDRFTRLAHFVPGSTTNTASDLARQFCNNVFRLHGLPDHIISDCGTTFASALWKEFSSLLGINLQFSTAFPPQMDGQTDHTNQAVKHCLRSFTNYHQTKGLNLLNLAECLYKNPSHLLTSQSPFHYSLGLSPILLLDSSVEPMSPPFSPSLLPKT